MATLWEPSYSAYDRGTRHSAGPQFHSCREDRRSGKDIYVCLKIIFLYYTLTYVIFLHTPISPWFAAELSIKIRTTTPQICASNVRLKMWLCVGCRTVHNYDNGETTIGRYSEQCSVWTLQIVSIHSIHTHIHTCRRGKTSNCFFRALLKKLQLLC